jgi:hypothetical protein
MYAYRRPDLMELRQFGVQIKINGNKVLYGTF